jgi:hypothetical protein
VTPECSRVCARDNDVARCASREQAPNRVKPVVAVAASRPLSGLHLSQINLARLKRATSSARTLPERSTESAPDQMMAAPRPSRRAAHGLVAASDCQASVSFGVSPGTPGRACADVVHAAARCSKRKGVLARHPPSSPAGAAHRTAAANPPGRSVGRLARGRMKRRRWRATRIMCHALPNPYRRRVLANPSPKSQETGVVGEPPGRRTNRGIRGGGDEHEMFGSVDAASKDGELDIGDFSATRTHEDTLTMRRALAINPGRQVASGGGSACERQCRSKHQCDPPTGRVGDDSHESFNVTPTQMLLCHTLTIAR